jgi:hypothetical protein
VTGELADTIDVTNQAAAEGRPLGHDWTEVVLLGNSPSLDTSGDPYAHDPPVPVTWVADDLYNKFFKLPDGVEIWLMNGANRLGGHRQFATMAQRATSAFAHYEAVNAGPATVHYFYDVREYGVGKSSVNALQNARGMVGLIYKDEIYDIQSEGLWVQLAPVFGIPFGAGSFTILIELPPDAHVLPDAYRQFLRYREQTQRHVAARDYSALVSQHRPQWLLDLLLQLAPDSAHAENVRGEMNELFKDLRVPRRSKRQPGPAIHGPPGDDWEVAPQIVTIRDNVDLEERGLRGRAARFYATTHQLFVNCLYPAVQDMRALLETEFSAEEEPELVRSQSLVLAEQAAVRAVGRHLVFCLARRAKDDTWHDLDHAMSPATLSIIADDYLPAMEAARKQMREAIALASTAKAA